MKTCTKCGESKPGTSEFFHAHSQPGRLAGWCKVCSNENNRVNHYKNKVVVRGQVSFDNEHYLLCMRLLPPGSMAGEVL